MTTTTEELSFGPVYEQGSVADSGEQLKHRTAYLDEVSRRAAGGAALRAEAAPSPSEEDQRYWANHLEVQGAQGC